MSDGGINKVIKVIAVAILLPLGVLIPALSLESYYAPQSLAHAETTSGLAARKRRYLKLLKEEITTSQQDHIKLRCLAVQSNVKTYALRIGTIKTDREEAYDTILAKLNKLNKGLKAQAYDTTEFESDIAVLQGHVDEFKSAMKSYKQVVEDMTEIDCTKDPAAFKAALEEARRLHLELIGTIQTIRADLVNTIKTSLRQLREDLAGSRIVPTTTNAKDKE